MNFAASSTIGSTAVKHNAEQTLYIGLQCRTAVPKLLVTEHVLTYSVFMERIFCGPWSSKSRRNEMC
jgi:hypothetical protein